MGRKVLLNYDELRTAVKKFRNEGEDIVQMHSTMRDRVRDLPRDWVGEGADKFIREMENDLLPALSRLAKALFYAQDVLQKIIKTIQTFDEETAGYFRADFDQVNPIHLGAFMAGGELGAGIGSMLGGSLAGGVSGAGSGEGGASGGGLSGAGSGDSSGGTGEPFPDSQAGSGQVDGVDQTPGAGGQSPGFGAGVGAGGLGGGSSSQGLQGNLQGMESGVSAQGGAGAGEGPMGGGSKIPDHIYEAASGAGAGGGSTPSSPAASSAGSGAQGSTGGETVAAGAAGVAGSAAIGGAAKSIQGRVRKKKK